MEEIKFPKNFYWGSATSAHQVEGDNSNSDWWEWEQDKNITNNDKSGKACDFWNRYREDLDLAKKLNQNAFRFSIEWAKIKPSNKQINESAIQHYQDVVDYCKNLGIEPFVTLHHFTNPKWFSDLGGWEKKENIKYFLEYVNLVTRKIEGVKYWISLNEPCVYANGSFAKGVWPPGKKNLFLAIKVVNNIIEAHNEVYKIIKKNCSDSLVGFSKNNAYFEGGLIAKKLKKYWNHYFLDKTQFDFIGLNYYFHDNIVAMMNPPFFKVKNKNKLVSDMKWEIYPEGIYHILMDLKKYKKPIIITENGLADAKDKLRAKFIVNHLRYVHRAIKNGVDIKGYLYWSLMDNFEWTHGFKPRFGLIEIDYKTQKRNIRSSALVYAKICKSGTI